MKGCSDAVSIVIVLLIIEMVPKDLWVEILRFQRFPVRVLKDFCNGFDIPGNGFGVAISGKFTDRTFIFLEENQPIRAIVKGRINTVLQVLIKLRWEVVNFDNFF